MPHRIRLAGKLPLSLIVSILLSLTVMTLYGSPMPAGYPAAPLSPAETSTALEALGLRLAANPGDYSALVERGWLYLALKDKDRAAADFKYALSSESDSLRISAYVGLGWCSYIPGKRRAASMDYIRRALSVDSHSAEALYAKTLIMLGGEPTTDDVRVAKRALFKLLEANFGYRDVYRLWREVVLDRTDAEIRLVDRLLSAYLATHPDSAEWRLELAWDRYLVDGPEAAGAELDLLAKNNPGFSHPDKFLLRARCKLETGDTLAFQSDYWQAVDLAGQSGEFGRLIVEASTIFVPGDEEKYEQAQANGTLQQFLHYFWANIDPVKINPINRRLAEHYFRLAVAQRNYRLRQPHNRFNTSKNFNRLLGFQGTINEYHSEKVTFSSGNPAGLDHRGLLYMRYGPPDYGKDDEPVENLKYKHGLLLDKMTNQMETWFYDNIPFVFERLPMTGEFIYRPLVLSVVQAYKPTHGDAPKVYPQPFGDMQKAMTRQKFRQPDVNESMEYYVAQFAAPNMEGIEIEIYQDENLPKNVIPTSAEAAAYDTLWVERQRRQSEFFRIPGERDNRWVAVHSLSYPPGKAKYAIKFAAGEKTWNGRGSLDMEPFDATFLELSAIVLGLDPPDQNSPSYERHGIRFIPRPSFRFKRGEVIRVYLEFYNLASGPERRLSFREYVDVIRYNGDRSILGRITGSLKGLLTFGNEKQSAQIRHRFDREAPSGDGPVAESFLLDSSELIPGSYRLLIEARDNVNSFWDDEAVMFEIYD